MTNERRQRLARAVRSARSKTSGSAASLMLYPSTFPVMDDPEGVATILKCRTCDQILGRIIPGVSVYCWDCEGWTDNGELIFTALIPKLPKDQLVDN
jgi:hypothetical protein